MSNISESSIVEDMKMYAVARIYLDNFLHLKAYWPMLGRQNAQLSLSFGVNDIDGTIDDSTKIYSMAGSEEQNPAMTTEQLVTLIKQVKRTPVERDTLYNVVKDYSEIDFNSFRGIFKSTGTLKEDMKEMKEEEKRLEDPKSNLMLSKKN
jgi:aminodeoxyfutalosine synthase